MALGEKTLLDLFTKKTDMAGEAQQPGAAALFARISHILQCTDEKPPVISTELPGTSAGFLARLALALLGFGRQVCAWVMSPGSGSSFPAACGSSSRSREGRRG